jgi:hypothetical protein
VIYVFLTTHSPSNERIISGYIPNNEGYIWIPVPTAITMREKHRDMCLTTQDISGYSPKNEIIISGYIPDNAGYIWIQP